MSRRHVVLAFLLLLATGGGFWFWHVPAPVTNDANGSADKLVADLQGTVTNYRKVIVLMADVDALNGAQRQQVITVGQALFHANQEQQAVVSSELWDAVASGVKGRFRRINAVLDYIESDSNLYDGDQLVFREPLQSLQEALQQNGGIEARKINRRVARDLHTIDGIEQQFDGEYEQLFSRSRNATSAPSRVLWNDYVATLRTFYQPAQILKEQGETLLPPPAPNQPPPLPVQVPPEEAEAHIFGNQFPPKVIALTFDDGPHPKYTAQVVAVLQRYHVPGTFFEIGRNIGRVDAKGQPVLGKNATITRMLIADGYAVGNHSFTHPVMSKEHGAQLLAEINDTDLLLKAIDKDREPIFRFPYGAHNAEGMNILAQDHLQSVLWNVDSLDWADPVPNSVADRVLREVDKVGHGIILFHDIHDRAPKALPGILDHLFADGYRFAGWDGHGFSVPPGPQGRQ